MSVSLTPVSCTVRCGALVATPNRESRLPFQNPTEHLCQDSSCVIVIQAPKRILECKANGGFAGKLIEEKLWAQTCSSVESKWRIQFHGGANFIIFEGCELGPEEGL